MSAVVVKHPDRKERMEERTCFSSQHQVPVSHRREVSAQEVRTTDPIHSQSEERMDACVLVTSGPNPEDHSPTFRLGLLASVKAIKAPNPSMLSLPHPDTPIGQADLDSLSVRLFPPNLCQVDS